MIRHLFIDGKGSKFEKLGSPRILSSILQKACNEAGAGVIHVITHGTVVMMILDAGHAVLRTYPDLGMWLADFVMHDLDPRISADCLAESFGGQSEISEMGRPIEAGFFEEIS